MLPPEVCHPAVFRSLILAVQADKCLVDQSIILLQSAQDFTIYSKALGSFQKARNNV